MLSVYTVNCNFHFLSEINVIMENETSFYEYIWREDLWFPVGVNGETYGWKDLESKPDSNEHYPQASDLHFGILLGVLMVVFRHFLERLS